jgi:VWFA-related protein
VRRFLLWFSFALPLTFLAFQMPADAQSSAPPEPPAQQQPTPPAGQSQSQAPNYSISVTVPVVNVDAVVTDNDGNYLNGLRKENFRILEDGAPQTITNFSTGDGPITIVLLLEFNMRGFGWYSANGINWADAFLRQLRPIDWVALESFSIRPRIEVDFTHDPREIEQALASMTIPPAFIESNLFDALIDVVDRLRDVKGRKAVLVLASGRDTFSKLTLDKTLARLKETDVTVFCVGVAEQLALQMEMYGGEGTNNLDFIQAQNQLKAFADLTGGRAWSPRFDGEIPGIMADVANSLRNQYSMAYTPINQNLDGKYRKIKVEVVNPDGSPLTVTNAKGKKEKIRVYARQGYTAPKSEVN